MRIEFDGWFPAIYMGERSTGRRILNDLQEAISSNASIKDALDKRTNPKLTRLWPWTIMDGDALMVKIATSIIKKIDYKIYKKSNPNTKDQFSKAISRELCDVLVTNKLLIEADKKLKVNIIDQKKVDSVFDEVFSKNRQNLYMQRLKKTGSKTNSFLDKFRNCIGCK